MQVFISMKAIRGDAELDALADQVSDAVVEAGHLALVATREIARLGYSAPAEFMPYVRRQIEVCDLMLVLYHPDLRGGLIELGLAYARGIPIWLWSPVGTYVSSSARGCADLRIEYSSLPDLTSQLKTCFQSETIWQ